jgi:hypothetical protein
MFSTWVFTVGRPMSSSVPMAASVRYVGRRASTRLSAGVREAVLRVWFRRVGFDWLQMVLWTLRLRGAVSHRPKWLISVQGQRTEAACRPGHHDPPRGCGGHRGTLGSSSRSCAKPSYGLRSPLSGTETWHQRMRPIGLSWTSRTQQDGTEMSEILAHFRAPVRKRMIVRSLVIRPAESVDRNVGEVDE